MYVIDHAIAIDLILNEGELKETYNIGGFIEWKNIDLVKVLCKQMDKKQNKTKNTSEKLRYDQLLGFKIGLIIPISRKNTEEFHYF